MKPLSPVDAALDRVRDICLGFPGAEEKLSHGAPSFRAGGPRGKMFLMFVDDHHADGRIAVWCKSSHEAQRRLVGSDPERFFVPPYVGVSGWVGVRLDVPSSDWIELAILVEEGWTSIAPKPTARTRDRAAKPPAPPPKRKKPPPRATTDANVAKAALERLTKICLALPEATSEKHSRHATYRVGKKTFAYFLDNHHGEGVIAACFKVQARSAAERPREAAKLVASDPEQLYVPAYIGARGWLGQRVDTKRVDWKRIAERVLASYLSVAPKRLAALVVSARESE